MERHLCLSCLRELPASDFPSNGPNGGWHDEAGVRHRSRCQKCEYTRRRARYDAAQEREVPARVPIEPFSLWLEEKYQLYARVHGPSLRKFSIRIGLGERQLECYLRRERPTITWALVDRVLVTEGSTALCELYPVLYPDLEMAA